MSKYVWIVEHREWTNHFMDCTTLYIASTLVANPNVTVIS